MKDKIFFNTNLAIWNPFALRKGNRKRILKNSRSEEIAIYSAKEPFIPRGKDDLILLAIANEAHEKGCLTLQFKSWNQLRNLVGLPLSEYRLKESLYSLFFLNNVFKKWWREKNSYVESAFHFFSFVQLESLDKKNISIFIDKAFYDLFFSGKNTREVSYRRLKILSSGARRLYLLMSSLKEINFWSLDLLMERLGYNFIDVRPIKIKGILQKLCDEIERKAGFKIVFEIKKTNPKNRWIFIKMYKNSGKKF
jgi:hypothetical protein